MLTSFPFLSVEGKSADQHRHNAHTAGLVPALALNSACKEHCTGDQFYGE